MKVLFVDINATEIGHVDRAAVWMPRRLLTKAAVSRLKIVPCLKPRWRPYSNCA